MVTLLTYPSASLSPASAPAGAIDGLYVHVPFCFHKCHYCDFYSITRQTDDRMGRFVDLVLDEADLWIRARSGPTPAPRTIFFGGGTPTLLPVVEMGRLLQGLRKRFDFSGLMEWTVEANPATVTSEYCSMLKDNGVNRLSFGAQSFSPDELAKLERHHRPQDVERSLSIARDVGFERLNLDLIYAIPGQTLEAWSRSLETAIGLGTSHLSCYGLTYEANTPMAVKKRLGQLRAVEEDIELSMLRHTRQRLESIGMPAYEISNYARPGEECRHNLMYWDGGSYIGLGPSAASHVHGWRWRNRPHLGEWEQAVGSGNLPAIDVEALPAEKRAGELAWLQLRLTRGLIYDDFAARSGFDARTLFRDPIERLSRVGLLDVSDQRVRLNSAGLAVADAIAGEFLDPTISP